MRAVSLGFLVAGSGLTVLALTVSILFPPHPWLIWNASASAPRGLYAVDAASRFHTGDLVLVTPTAAIRDLAARRGYLPAGVPLIKHIAALAGHRVCSDGTLIRIDGAPAATRLATDTHHRVLPVWKGCFALAPAQEFLLMADVADSFDGRYFGATPTANNLGRLIPLWTY